MKKRVTSIICYGFAVFWMIITVLPLIITFFSSLKNNSEISLGLFSLPQIWRWENYIKANDIAHAATSITNSLILGLATTFAVTIVGMMAAYVISRKRLKWLKYVNLLFVLGIMIPVHCTMVPISNIAVTLNAKNSYIFLFLIYITFNLPQAIYLYAGYLDGIDRELDEAAIIDGCGDFRLLWKVLVPVSKPIIMTEAVFVFVYAYSELIFSLVLITDQSKYTVSRGILSFVGEHSAEYGPQFGFIIMAIIPTVIIYILFHNRVEAGMLSGAVKG